MDAFDGARRVRQPLDVGVHHHPDQFLEADARRPPELALGLRRVAEQPIDFGRAQELRIHAHVALPVEAGVREGDLDQLADIAFRRIGRDWRDHVREDPSLKRPAEVDLLIGDAAKARRMLGWQPTVTFAGLVEMMVDADLQRYARP